MPSARRVSLVVSSLLPLGVSGVLAACSFDTSGNGFPSGASVGDGSSSDESGDRDEPPADQEPAPDATTTPSSTGGGGPHASAGGEDTDVDEPDDDGFDEGSAASHSGPDDDASTGEPAAPMCSTTKFEILWVDDAQLAPPMQLLATDANDSPNVATSSVADSGEVTVAIEFACAGSYTVWGLVWDYSPGAWSEPDPDSFFFDVGGAESTWRYGCQTADSPSGLSWQRLTALEAQPCDVQGVVLDVDAPGTVELTLRNREAGSGSQVAGIAAIVVSDDPEADPSALYAPY